MQLPPLVRLVAATTVYSALLFITAGTVTWPGAWAYLLLVTTSLVVYSTILARLHPDLIAERTHPPPDAKKWDKPFVTLVGGVGPLSWLVLCGLDHRFGWTPPVAGWLVVAGLTLVVAGHVVTNLAVAANRFFSAFVRIQRDRGHRVIDSGPYRVVRHPGYAGAILNMAGGSLALGSAWGMVVAVLVSVVLVIRTELEDRTLRAELEGYREYASRVRFRLLPGIW